MASTNAGPEYGHAEKNYLNAKDVDDKIFWLSEMIKFAPKHKSSEKMVDELKTRLIKLRDKKEKSRSVGKSTVKAIKKEGPQAALIGFTNSGKSSVLSALTNAKTLIADYDFTTKIASVGTMDQGGVKVQIIDLPALNHESFDKGIVNTTDLLLIIITDYDEIDRINPFLERSEGKRLYVVNKVDLLSSDARRKIEAKLRSNKVNFAVFSSKTLEGLDNLKSRILSHFNIIRVFTKEPKKEKSPYPVILKPGATVGDLAEKIYHGMSRNIKETKIWGPSSKFPGQAVGLKHGLKDLDVVEFRTK
jgi:ribosome-interacting GTPase 1